MSTLSGPEKIAPSSRMIRRARHALEQRKPGKAERLCAELLQHSPNDVDALHLLGMLNHQGGKLDAALALVRAALTIDDRRADMWSDLGLIFLTMGRFEEALASYDRAHVIAPDDLEALNGRGVALLRLDRIAEAIASYDRVLAVDPAHIDALGNRGNALLRLNRPQDAMASYEAALKRAPRHPRLLTNHATALRRLDRPHEALMCLSRALAANPDFAEARFVESLVKLTLGDFGAGWRAYESRWATAAFAARRRNFTPPLWLGDRSLAGKTILLHGEQGCGDTIQFVRYAPRVAALGAKVILEVQPELARLVARIEGVGTVVARGKPLPAFDFHCPMMSLPLAFATTLETIPADVPYLSAPPAYARKWAQRLPKSGLPRIGIAWAGNPNFRHDRARSVGLTRMLPFLSRTDVQYVGLQRDLRDGDAEILWNNPQVEHLGNALETFADSAAVIASLDLIISIDSATVHLAGALGKPVWVLLPYSPDWRWLLDRNDSPWYPTARLFRQARVDDWSGVVESVTEELAHFAPSFRP
jgi:tetratricopeptide (TPR) repeat protein